jgi:hypothetical protein
MFDEFIIEANGLIFSPGGSTAGEPLLGRSVASGTQVRINSPTAKRAWRRSGLPLQP